MIYDVHLYLLYIISPRHKQARLRIYTAKGIRCVHKWQASSSGNTQWLHNPFQFIYYPLYFFCSQFIAKTIIYLVTVHLISYCLLEGAILVAWQIMVRDRMLFPSGLDNNLCSELLNRAYCKYRNNPNVQIHDICNKRNKMNNIMKRMYMKCHNWW